LNFTSRACASCSSGYPQRVHGVQGLGMYACFLYGMHVSHTCTHTNMCGKRRHTHINKHTRQPHEQSLRICPHAGTIKKGEKVFEVPRELQLNLEMVRSDPVMGKIYNETPALHDGMSVCLSVCLSVSQASWCTFFFQAKAECTVRDVCLCVSRNGALCFELQRHA
jgi:hypothetical protein